jgi:hypothetical protein
MAHLKADSTGLKMVDETALLKVDETDVTTAP